MQTTAIGRSGEDIARQYLEAKGMRFREKNYKRRHGEVDLIMDDGKWLVFVEVKTRRSLAYGMPAEAVTPYKQKHIRYCADMYFFENKITSHPARFDIVEVLMMNGTVKIHHIRNAF